MKKRLLCAVLVFVAGSLSAGEPPLPDFTIAATEQKHRTKYPGLKRLSDQLPPGVTAHSNLVYASYGKRQMHLDLFQPQGRGPFPAVILVHGGAWTTGNHRMENPFAMTLAARGFVAATVEYRLSGEAIFPAQIHDLKASVRWLRANAATYGIDASRIGAVGASAGGQLVTLLGVTAKPPQFEGNGGNESFSSAVQAVVNIDGAADFTDPGTIARDKELAVSGIRLFLGGSYESNPKVWRDASPLTHVNSHSAPVLFIKSSGDRPFLRREEMSAQLKAFGVDSKIVLIPDSPHPFWLFHPWFTQTLEYTIDWLNKMPHSSRTNNANTAKTETFDRDPGWEGRNNRAVPATVDAVTQDFGYSPKTHFAGKEAGEMGGSVSRTTKPAWYADRIAPKTLKDKLNASGTVAFTRTMGSSGVFFGFFNAKQPGGSKPVNSLGMHFGAQGGGVRVGVRLITASNKSAGMSATPHVKGQGKERPIKTDGTRYSWTLSYDPDANDAKGRVEFTFNSETFTLDLPAGFKEESVSFDRFGMMNPPRPGNSLTVWFDDLQYDGRSRDFSKEPNWEGVGNRTTYQPEIVAGANDFGFSKKTSFAGGAPGEMGGVIWRRKEPLACYADRVGPFSLDDRLEASGKVMLATGGVDSGANIGWFSSDSKEANIIGVSIGGPTRVGHYFRPQCATAKGTRRQMDKGPVIVPGKLYEWSLLYDPAGNNGKGSIRVTLGGESITLDLKPGDKAQGARLDRFGLFSTLRGGNFVKIWFDNLQYTAGRSSGK